MVQDPTRGLCHQVNISSKTRRTPEGNRAGAYRPLPPVKRMRDIWTQHNLISVNPWQSRCGYPHVTGTWDTGDWTQWWTGNLFPDPLVASPVGISVKDSEELFRFCNTYYKKRMKFLDGFTNFIIK